MREASGILRVIEACASSASTSGDFGLAADLLTVIGAIGSELSRDPTVDRAPNAEMVEKLRAHGIDFRDTGEDDKLKRAMLRADRDQGIADTLQACAAAADAGGRPDLATEIRDAANDLIEWQKTEYAVAHHGPSNRLAVARMFPWAVLPKK